MENNQNSSLADIDLNNLGNFIRSKRREIGLTQSEVAETINVSSQHYSRIERGEYIPSLQTFFKLADVLKIDVPGINLNSSGKISSTMYEIVTLLKKFNTTQQKAVLNFLQTMTA